MLASKHLLDLESVSSAELRTILDTAEAFLRVMDRPIPKVPVMRGFTVANLFFEPSTRTRISFELAEKRLSADVINFSASGSSVSKGETLQDTADNILAMRCDMIVIRHGSSGAARYLSERVDAGVGGRRRLLRASLLAAVAVAAREELRARKVKKHARARLRDAEAARDLVERLVLVRAEPPVREGHHRAPAEQRVQLGLVEPDGDAGGEADAVVDL